MQRKIAAALISTTALGGCAGQQSTSAPSAATSHTEVRDWDRSSIQSVGGERFAFVGPVLQSVDPLDRRERASVISRRCLWIAQGVPYLRLPDAIRLAPNEAEAFFVPTWAPSEAARRDGCGAAFGAGWRLPTVEQARAVLAPPDAPWGWLSIFVRDEVGRIDTLRRETDRCSGLDPHCKPYVRLTQGTAAQADLYCVGPASELPPADPSNAEIARCVQAVTRTVRKTGEQVPHDVVDEDLLDFIFAVRRACLSNAQSDYDAIVERVRKEVGSATVADRMQELHQALGRLSGHAARVGEALEAVKSGSVLTDCADFPRVYRGKCTGAAGADDCLRWQAQYVARCLNRDVLSNLTALADNLAASLAELQGKARRYWTLDKATDLAAQCSRPLDTTAKIRRVLGRHIRTSEAPRYCTCPAEDLDCGLAASRDPSGCPEHRATKSDRPHRCGCAQGDLACHMRCKD